MLASIVSNPCTGKLCTQKCQRLDSKLSSYRTNLNTRNPQTQFRNKINESRPSLWITGATDYVASSTDDGVLRLPPRMELDPYLYTHVFGYARDLHDKYFLGKVIGAGSFGVVRDCIQKSTGNHYAIKTVGKAPKKGATTPRHLIRLRTEVEIMEQLGYSLDAVNLMEVFEDNTSIHLVMELCDGGVLLERIESQRHSERFVVPIMRSALRFISQCHAKGIIYRDVKPDNFLFTSRAEDAHLKATDFGLAIRHTPSEPKLTSRSGTPAYMAPEVVNQSYDHQCDVWSVGMMCYQLLTGRFPYWDDIRHYELAEVWYSILTQPIDWSASELRLLSPAAVDFLKKLLAKDSRMRYTAAQALEHPWLKDCSNASDMPLCGTVVQRLQRFSTYGHLKQFVLQLIAYDMEDQKGISQNARASMSSFKELFQQMDTDKSGSISFDELRDGLARQGYELESREVEQLMKKVDENHSGTIDLAEFSATLMDWNLLQQDKTWSMYLDRAFIKLDHDGDGAISLNELLDVLPRGTESDAERISEAKAMLREADSDGDGMISHSDFYALLKDVEMKDDLSFYDDRLPSPSPVDPVTDDQPEPLMSTL